MTNDEGGVPLDQKLRDGSKPEAGKTGPLSDAETNKMMQQVMAYLHTEAGKGNIVSLSCVFVDKSDIPQHAFMVKPNGAAVLLGGVLIAEDQIKGALTQSMDAHRNKLIKEAQEAERKLNGAVTQPGNA